VTVCANPAFLTSPILLWCVFTQAVGGFGFIYVVLSRQPLWMFMPFLFVNGCGGGSWVLVTLLTASLTDLTEDEAGRSRVLRMFMAVFNVCGAVGPILGGQLTSHVGQLFAPSTRCSSWCHGGSQQANMLVFFVTNVLLVFLCLAAFRESLPVGKRQQTLDDAAVIKRIGCVPNFEV
jgi:MFS family permease